jgi:hypothetical protein
MHARRGPVALPDVQTVETPRLDQRPNLLSQPRRIVALHLAEGKTIGPRKGRVHGVDGRGLEQFERQEAGPRERQPRPARGALELRLHGALRPDLASDKNEGG